MVILVSTILRNPVRRQGERRENPHLQRTRRVGEEVVLQNLPIEHIELRCTVYSLGLVPGPADHVSDCRGVNCVHEFVMEAIANKNGGFPGSGICSADDDVP